MQVGKGRAGVGILRGADEPSNHRTCASASCLRAVTRGAAGGSARAAFLGLGLGLGVGQGLGLEGEQAWDWGEGWPSAAPPEQRLGQPLGQRSARFSVLVPSREAGQRPAAFVANVSAVPCPRRDASGGLSGRRG